jgi:hypothetical protein
VSLLGEAEAEDGRHEKLGIGAVTAVRSTMSLITKRKRGRKS